MATKKPLFIIDGSAYVFRAFYAVKGLSNSEGFPTNALYGFTNMLIKLLDQTKPEYLAVVFDPRGPTTRNELFADYKANRDSPPDELMRQAPLIQEVVAAFNIPIFMFPGIEADDVIGTLVHKAQQQGVPVVMISADKDLMQLISEDVSMWDTMRNRVFKVADVIDRFQVPPEKVPDVMGLAGDSSDNIPGVPGIGEKIGGQLIKDFGSLEKVLNHIDAVSGKKRKENLEQFADQARLSKILATISTDLDITFDLEQTRVQEPDAQRLVELFTQFEFKGFVSRYEKQAERVYVTPEKHYETILTNEQFTALLKELRSKKRFAVDLETTGIDPMVADIVGISFSTEAHHGTYIPLAHRYMNAPHQLNLGDVLAALKPLLQSKKVEIYGQNTKYERLIFGRHDIDLQGIRCDTLLAAYLLDPGRLRNSLDVLSEHYLRYKTTRYSDVAGKGVNEIGFWEVPIDKATHYAAEDADVTFQLGELLVDKLDKVGMRSLHDDIELPLSRVLAIMELHGVLIDASILERASVQFDKWLQVMEGEIYKIAGESFNINSPKQLARQLYERAGLPVRKRLASGPSTDQSVLEQLAAVHPLPDKVLEYRSISKLKSTYADALPKLISPKTGRIHTNFNQTVTSTGRLSSSDPNLQNIPVRTEMGREIRRAFIAPEGSVLLSADYSQIELRILAHISQDPKLLSAFATGQDIHKRTAAEIFSVDIEEVTQEQRRIGKTINFGTIYGMGATRLARDLKIERKQAQAFLNSYFERYSGITTCVSDLIDRARKKGFSETLLHRRRLLPELNTGAYRERSLGERLAVNTPIQGSAADLIKIAMLRIQKRLEDEHFYTKMVLQVHDEIVFEVPQEELSFVKWLGLDEMTGAMALDVPLVVDMSDGPHWAALK